MTWIVTDPETGAGYEMPDGLSEGTFDPNAYSSGDPSYDPGPQDQGPTLDMLSDAEYQRYLNAQATPAYGDSSLSPGVGQGNSVWNAIKNGADWLSKNVSFSGGSPSSSLGGLASGAAASAANGRLSEAQLALQRDQTRSSVYNTQQNAALRAAEIDLLRRKYLSEAPAVRMSNAAKGSQLANAQDVVASHPRANVVHFAGGLRPSNLTPQTRALGSKVAQDMLAQQNANETFPDLASLLLKAPNEMTMPEASAWEQILGGVGLGSQLLGTGLNVFNRLAGNGGAVAQDDKTTAKKLSDYYLEDQVG